MKCLDLELTTNQILYIPAYWFFSIKYLEKSLICNLKYSTFMNSIAILPEFVMHLLQHNNTKKQITKVKENIKTKIDTSNLSKIEKNSIDLSNNKI